MATVRPVDEAVGADAAHAPRWAIAHHQFDLVRSDDGVRYLRRWWIVKTPLGGIVLHRMDGPDARASVHDHPFSFVSVMLRGGYIERRLNVRDMTTYWRTVRRFNVVRKHDAHSIRSLTRTPTFTLLFVGPHRRTWGFWEATTRHGVWRWTKHDAFDSGHYVP